MAVSAKLTIIGGSDRGKELSITEAPIAVGRYPTGDLVISDADLGVSGKHFEIRYRRGEYCIYNYGKNGTLVNGREVSEGVLNDGDQIQIGFSTVLQFKLEGLTKMGPGNAS